MILSSPSPNFFLSLALAGRSDFFLGNDAELKKKAVEQIDKYVVGPVFDTLQKYDSWKMLVVPDHPTPVYSCAHSDEPVPFAMAGTGITGILNANFSEANAEKSGFRIENDFELMEYFLKT